jgi:hypothetical protein
VLVVLVELVVLVVLVVVLVVVLLVVLLDLLSVGHRDREDQRIADQLRPADIRCSCFALGNEVVG